MKTDFTALTILMLSALFVLSSNAIAQPVNFSKEIRPILSDKCFACHGPDAKHREGGFRLDKKESAFGVGDSDEKIITPGNAATSALIARIVTEDADLKMPPADSEKVITPEELEKIKRWIKQGAEWKEHWAYQAPGKTELPEVKKKNWETSAIDRFILARLKKEKLSPNQQADKITLIRRVSFDLTGLPPTIAEVESFLKDDSANAYEKVVDRLLASPRYGENMSRYWLDAVRYGDTHGLHLDNYREMWAYRDWVVRSFNKNLPYDQFTLHQLAGDLLENPTQDQMIATGFNRCHVTTNEGGSIKEEVYVRNVVDRVVTFGTVFLGATFDCTRCHDHKFDPFTQHDFYSMFAFFNSMNGEAMDGNVKNSAPYLLVTTPEQQVKLDQFDSKMATLNKRLKTMEPRIIAAQKKWEVVALENAKNRKEIAKSWKVLVPKQYVSLGNATLKLQEDQSILASGKNPAKEVYEVVTTIKGNDWQSIRLEGLVDSSLAYNGAGRSENSNVVLTGFEAFLATADQPEQWQPITFKTATADHEQGNGDYKVTNAIDGNPKTGWAIAGHEKRVKRTASFVAEKPFGTEDEAVLKIVLKHQSQFPQHQFGRFRLSVSEKNVVTGQPPKDVLAILRRKQKARKQKQKDRANEYYREKVSDDVEFVPVYKEYLSLKRARQRFTKPIPTTLIFKEKATPQKAFLLNRGEYDQKKEEVARRTPLTLPAMKKGLPNDRLGLAKWLVDAENPLMARVTVNRFWQQLFGTGIIKTAADLGSQGEPPMHPELLDWLAVEFRESNWDVKRLMKMMVMSSTYQQSSKLTAELIQKDPENRLYARGPRFRLDAEPLRDQALFVSGLLVEKQGGPSVKPPQPDGLWFAVGYSDSNTAKFKPDTGSEKIHRRTLYTFIKRTALPPGLSTFDTPSREASCVRRERTNTPMQALLLFNDPQFLECAQSLASRAMREKGDSVESIASHMFQLCLSRKPNPKELQILMKGYQNDLKRLTASPEEAAELIKVGSPKVAQDLPVNELAAWTITANILLCTDEVITKN